MRYYYTMYYIVFVALVVLLPHTTHAATGSLQGLLTGIGGFIDQVLIPLVLGIAFLSVVWNTVRFFIIGADNEESQQNAKTLAFYSVAAFVLFLSFWGIVNMLSDGIGLTDAPCEDMQSDYYRLNTQAPCTSLIPPPRPHDAVDSSSPDGLGEGTGTDGLPIIPDADSGVTLPTGSTLPLPPNPDESPTDYQNVLVYADAVRLAARTYFANTITANFGINAAAVKNTLFADIPTSNSAGYTDADRAVAMYRLQALEIVPADTVTSFIARTNAYGESIGTIAGPLTVAAIKARAETAVPLPTSLVTTLNQHKESVITALTEFSALNTPELLNEELFDRALSPNQRYTNFQEYYSEGALYDQFVLDIKTEKIFAGDYSQLP